MEHSIKRFSISSRKECFNQNKSFNKIAEKDVEDANGTVSEVSPSLLAVAIVGSGKCTGNIYNKAGKKNRARFNYT